MGATSQHFSDAELRSLLCCVLSPSGMKSVMLYDGHNFEILWAVVVFNVVFVVHCLIARQIAANNSLCDQSVFCKISLFGCVRVGRAEKIAVAIMVAKRFHSRLAGALLAAYAGIGWVARAIGCAANTANHGRFSSRGVSACFAAV